MKVIIAGSRSIDEITLIPLVVGQSQMKEKITEVVCGMARGVDLMGKQWAEENHIPVKEFPADWNGRGQAAGHVRNVEMSVYADALIVIWDGRSPGSAHMTKTMKARGKPVYVYNASAKNTLTKFFG